MLNLLRKSTRSLSQGRAAATNQFHHGTLNEVNAQKQLLKQQGTADAHLQVSQNQ